MTDSKEDDEWDSTWHGLDETAFRLRIRKLLATLDSHEVEDESRLARQFAAVNRIVREETARAFEPLLNLYVELKYSPANIETAREAAVWAGQHLGAMGLVIKHPQSGEPVRLALAATPPGPNQSWLQLEPLDPLSRQPAYRVPMPGGAKFDLAAAPLRDAGPERPSPRR